MIEWFLKTVLNLYNIFDFHWNSHGLTSTASHPSASRLGLIQKIGRQPYIWHLVTSLWERAANSCINLKYALFSSLVEYSLWFYSFLVTIYVLWFWKETLFKHVQCYFNTYENVQLDSLLAALFILEVQHTSVLSFPFSVLTLTGSCIHKTWCMIINWSTISKIRLRNINY